jgi:ribosomal protein S18 acetylase RimI-like enzyme
MIIIRPLTSADHNTLRDTRLRALADTPLAFGSSYARESLDTPQQWQQRAEKWTTPNQARCFLAFDEDRGGTCCGIVACFKDEQRAGSVAIVSMWVAPEARRKGLGRRLIGHVEQWARDQGAEQLRLHATETNLPAIELYLRCGFDFTGETEPYPNDTALQERVMVKSLHASP